MSLNSNSIEVITGYTIVEFTDTYDFVEIDDKGYIIKAPAVIRSLINADLTNSKIVITHNLNLPDGVCKVTLFNQLNNERQPANVRIMNNNSVEVSLEGYTPITGIWKVKIS